MQMCFFYMENIGIPYEQLPKMKYIFFCIIKWIQISSYLILKMPTHQAMRKWLRQQLLDADEESRTWRLRAIQVCDKMPVFFWMVLDSGVSKNRGVSPKMDGLFHGKA